MTKITKTPTANMTREEWLAERRKSVGTSNAINVFFMFLCFILFSCYLQYFIFVLFF